MPLVFIHLHTHPSPCDKFLKWQETINDYINTVSIPLLPPPPYILLTHILLKVLLQLLHPAHHHLVLSACQGRAIVHLSGWFGCRCHSCRKTRQDFRRNRSTPPDDISRDICKSLAITCVAHSHIPCTWFELQRVKCCFRLGWISKGASRAALFSPPIVFFVKSCSLLLDFFLGSLDHIKGLMKC